MSFSEISSLALSSATWPMTESSRAFTLAKSESNKFLNILSCNFNDSLRVAIVTTSHPAESKVLEAFAVRVSGTVNLVTVVNDK